MKNSQLESDLAVAALREKRIRKQKLDPEKLLKSAICATCGMPKLPTGKCTYCVRRKQRETAIRRQKELQHVYKKDFNEIEREFNRIFESEYHGRRGLPGRGTKEKLKFETLLVALIEITKMIDTDNDTVNVLPHEIPRLIRVIEASRRCIRAWSYLTDERREDLRAHIGPLVAGSFGLTI